MTCRVLYIKEEAVTHRKRRVIGSVKNFYNVAVESLRTEMAFVAIYFDTAVKSLDLPKYAHYCQIAPMIPLDIFSRLLIPGWQFDYFFEFKNFRGRST